MDNDTFMGILFTQEGTQAELQVIKSYLKTARRRHSSEASHLNSRQGEGRLKLHLCLFGPHVCRSPEQNTPFSQHTCFLNIPVCRTCIHWCPGGSIPTWNRLTMFIRLGSRRKRYQEAGRLNQPPPNSLHPYSRDSHVGDA